MTKPVTIRFATSDPVPVPLKQLTPIHLVEPEPSSPHVGLTNDGIVFHTEGWYEVLLEVHWDGTNARGTRFSHTKIPGQQPLHSEAIAADVLALISEGRQLLRGNSLFGPDRTSSLILEVWQDSEDGVEVREASLSVRELCVPWPPRAG